MSPHTGSTAHLSRAICTTLLLLTALLLAACSTGSASPTEAPAAGTPDVAAATPAATSAATPAPQPPAESTPPPGPTLPEPTEWTWVVGKEDPLPDGYAPDDLVTLAAWASPNAAAIRVRREPAEALVEMLEDAREAGLTVRIVSAYRSYEQQIAAHEGLASRVGRELALRRSALPGHSEHQLGSTVDFTSPHIDWAISVSFERTPEGIWIREHAHEYGFALSYPEDSEEITGYVYEPWHYRYIGRDHAQHWHERGVTLIEYLREVEAQHAGH